MDVDNNNKKFLNKYNEILTKNNSFVRKILTNLLYGKYTGNLTKNNSFEIKLLNNLLYGTQLITDGSK
jgi:hypothetical protein